MAGDLPPVTTTTSAQVDRPLNTSAPPSVYVAPPEITLRPSIHMEGKTWPLAFAFIVGVQVGMVLGYAAVWLG